MTFSNPLKSQEIGVEKDAGVPASTCEESRCAEARREAPGPHPADLEDPASCTLEVVSREGTGRGETQPPAHGKDLQSFPAKGHPGDGVMTHRRTRSGHHLPHHVPSQLWKDHDSAPGLA